MNIAVVGGGVSGITAAQLLSQKFNVTLFEKEGKLGGHTNTIEVLEKSGEKVFVDTGFIVLNDCNYGVLHNLFSSLQAEVRWSDMSFSFFNPSNGYYYAGTDIFGIFPEKI